MAINGAYRWLSGHGREPDSVIVVDPLPSMAGLFGDIGDAVFYVADHVDPTVFDAVKNIVTFTNIEGDEDVDGLPGGPTALTRAPVLALYLGYRDITLFGADSCYRGDTTHSYEHKPNPDVFTFSGWETDVQLLAQAQYLAAMWPALERAATVEIVGNHLASRLILGE